MATCAPAITDFRNVLGAVHAAGHGNVRADVAVDHRGPVEPQQQFAGMAEGEAGHNFQLIDVQVGLIETVEKDQGVRAGCIDMAREICDGAEEVGKLYGDGNS